MSYNVGVLWGVYLVVLVVSFIIFYLLLGSMQEYCPSINIASAFFLATLLGAIAVFVGAVWLNTGQLNTGEQMSLSILFIVAFLLPIFTILYIVYAGNYMLPEDCLVKDKCCKDESTTIPHNEKFIQCDRDTGICYVEKEKIYDGDNVTTVIYSSKEHGNYAMTNIM